MNLSILTVLSMLFIGGLGTVPAVVWIKKSGVVDPNPRSLIMVFYVTVSNGGVDLMVVDAQEKRCCQVVEEGDTDCDSMQLIDPIEPVFLYPKNDANLTLIYANPYMYDRKGSCRVEVSYSPEDLKDPGYLETDIRFDTTIPATGVWLPRFLEDVVRKVEVTDCSSPDLDRLNRCAPVDCWMKYEGWRSFWNASRRRCQAVPDCGEELHEGGLPSTVRYRS